MHLTEAYTRQQEKQMTVKVNMLFCGDCGNEMSLYKKKGLFQKKHIYHCEKCDSFYGTKTYYPNGEIEVDADDF